MKYRKLRIAWSVAWGVACLLIVVLWVRSYWRWDSIAYSRSDSDCVLESTLGGVKIYYRLNPIVSFETSFGSGPTDRREWRRELFIGLDHDESAPNFYLVYWPHWLTALVFAAFASIPWINWRFSLRTLLIVITVAAIVLGLAVYALRSHPSAP